LSTSQEAVAWGMSGWANWSSRNDKGRPFTERPASVNEIGKTLIRSNPKLQQLRLQALSVARDGA